MRVPGFIVRPLARFIRRRYVDRLIPSQTIHENGPKSPVLIQRYNILTLPFISIRAHEIVRSDNIRDLHDHPWWNATLVLEGGYYEVTRHDPTEDGGYIIGDMRRLHEGDFYLRPAEARHRIVLDGQPVHRGSVGMIDIVDYVDVPCLTLFIHGPVTRLWGYWSPEGQFRPYGR